MPKYSEGFDYDEEVTQIQKQTAERQEEYVKEHTDLRRETTDNN